MRQKDVNNIAHVWPGETKVGNANNALLPKGITKKHSSAKKCKNTETKVDTEQMQGNAAALQFCPTAKTTTGSYTTFPSPTLNSFSSKTNS